MDTPEPDKRKAASGYEPRVGDRVCIGRGEVRWTVAAVRADGTLTLESDIATPPRRPVRRRVASSAVTPLPSSRS